MNIVLRDLTLKSPQIRCFYRGASPMFSGRSAELKAKFFSELNQKLVGTRYLEAENIFINLVEVARENWSFGISNV